MTKKLLICLFIMLSLVSCSLREEEERESTETVNVKLTKEQLSAELFKAVLAKDINKTKDLISKGAPLEAYGDQGQTVLMRATQLRDTVLVNVLIESGAKIFAPKKGNPRHSAHLDIHAFDSQITKLFEEEEKRLQAILSDYFSNHEIKEASNFVQENFIPLDFILLNQKSVKSEVLFSEFEIGPDRIEFIKYLFNGREYDKIDSQNIQVKEQMIKLTSEYKDTSFLEFAIIKIYSSNDSENLYFAESDYLDITWMTNKLEVLFKNSVSLSLEFLENTKTQMLALDSQDLEKRKVEFERFFKAAAMFIKSNSIALNEFTKNTLTELSQKISEDAQYMKFHQEIVLIWSQMSVSASTHSIDQLMSSFIKSVDQSNYDYAQIEHVRDSFLNFTSNRDSLHTFEAIFESSLRISQKTEVIELILGYTINLPKGVLAKATSWDSIFLMNRLLDSNLPFDPKDQVDAVLAAVANTQSGDIAKSTLLVLKEKEIPFDTEYAGKALLSAYQKLWGDDETYKQVIDFLLAISPSPLGSLTNEQKTSLLRGQFKFIIENDGQVSRLDHLLQKIKSPILGNKLYPKSLNLDGKHHFANVSFVWDYILSMYDFTNNHPEKLGIALAALRRITAKFPEAKVAMQVYSKGMITKNDAFIRQIIPLALLMALDSSDVMKFIQDESNSQGKVFKLIKRSKLVSVREFVQGDFYKYYSQAYQAQEYWINVTQVLLKNYSEVDLTSNRSLVDFFKVLFKTDVFDKFPEFFEKLKMEELEIDKAHKECIFEENGYEAMKIETVNERARNWTTLGSFEALKPLKQKTCNDVPLSKNELQFVKRFISHNLGKVSGEDLEYIKTVDDYKIVDCHEYKEKNKSQYTWTSNILGVAVKSQKDQHRDDPLRNIDRFDDFDITLFKRKCRLFEYKEIIHQKAKISFLNQWLKCSIDNKHLESQKVFESLDLIFPNLNLTPSNEDYGIKLCEM